MNYKSLNFEDYYIICSQNYNKLDLESLGKQDLELANYDEEYYFDGKHKHTVNYQVRYDEERNCIQVIFQQTASKSDWKSNFEYPAKIYDAFSFDNQIIQLKIHQGWLYQWLACKDKIRDKVEDLLKHYPNAFIEVFGWSLGSAIAQIASEDIYFRFNRKPYLYTYGSVKPFYGHKTKKYLKQCCTKAYNFYDVNDIVGYMVPLPFYFAIRHCKVRTDKLFLIHRLFNPWKYHTCYWQSQLYTKYLKP